MTVNINIEDHKVSGSEPIALAMEKLNLPGHLKTLFVVSENNQVIGAITDGDIRRGLLQGLTINNSCEDFAFKNFHFIQEGNINLLKIKELQEKQILVLPFLNPDHSLKGIVNFNQQKSLIPATAVIMAGGFGNRLRPLTETTPKPMLPVGGIPILEINIKRLAQFGVQEIFIAVNYLKDQIKNHFKNGEQWGVNIQYLEENEPLGTVGALSMLPADIAHNQILLFNADLLSDINFEELYIKHISQKSDLTIASIPHKVTLPYAVLEESNNHISAISEKPTFTYFANAGFYLFETNLLNRIPQNKFYNATDFAEDLIQNKFKVQSFPIHGYWNDIGSLQDYHKSNEDFKTIHFF